MKIYDYIQKIKEVIEEARNDQGLTVDEYVNFLYHVAGEARDQLEIEGVNPYKPV